MATEKIVCDLCKGLRIIRMNGGMRRNCEKCDATGWIDKAKEEKVLPADWVVLAETEDDKMFVGGAINSIPVPDELISEPALQNQDIGLSRENSAQDRAQELLKKAREKRKK